MSGPRIPGRGVLFAIDDDELARLGEASNDDEVRALVGAIEERWEHACELDKAWDAIHRALTDGKLALPRPGDRPSALARAVLGGTLLLDAPDAIVSAKAPDEVQAIARALSVWDRARFRSAYYRIDREDYGDLDEEDLEHCLAWFERMVAFYREAAQAERAVVFSTDL
jgi:hypothetical protein